MRTKTPSIYVSVVSRTNHMRVPRKRIFQLAEFVASKTQRPILDVDVAVVDSREMGSYNRRYLHHAGTTDVISFDLSDAPDGPLIAQIIVCGQVAVRQAAKHACGVQRELLLYITHGLLHLLGYDDRKKQEAKAMSLYQEQLLDEFFAMRRQQRTR